MWLAPDVGVNTLLRKDEEAAAEVWNIRKKYGSSHDWTRMNL